MAVNKKIHDVINRYVESEYGYSRKELLQYVADDFFLNCTEQQVADVLDEMEIDWYSQCENKVRRSLLLRPEYKNDINGLVQYMTYLGYDEKDIRKAHEKLTSAENFSALDGNAEKEICNAVNQLIMSGHGYSKKELAQQVYIQFDLKYSDGQIKAVIDKMDIDWYEQCEINVRNTLKYSPEYNCDLNGLLEYMTHCGYSEEDVRKAYKEILE